MNLFNVSKDNRNKTRNVIEYINKLELEDYMKLLISIGVATEADKGLLKDLKELK